MGTFASGRTASAVGSAPHAERPSVSVSLISRRESKDRKVRNAKFEGRTAARSDAALTDGVGWNPGRALT